MIPKWTLMWSTPLPVQVVCLMVAASNRVSRTLWVVYFGWQHMFNVLTLLSEQFDEVAIRNKKNLMLRYIPKLFCVSYVTRKQEEVISFSFPHFSLIFCFLASWNKDLVSDRLWKARLIKKFDRYTTEDTTATIAWDCRKEQRPCQWPPYDCSWSQAAGFS